MGIVKKYHMLLMVAVTFFSCNREKKVEQVQMPGPGYEEILHGPVHTVKLLMYNVTKDGDSLVKKDRFKEKTDLNLPTWNEALVTFNKTGLCLKIEAYKYGTSTIGGGLLLNIMMRED